MHESTKQKIDEYILKSQLTGLELYLSVMFYYGCIKFWSDNREEVEKYVFNLTILKDGV